MTDHREPILFLVRRPDQLGLDRIGDTYDLRDRPEPGIRIVVTSGSEGLDAATMDALPDLALIAVAAVGYDAVDVAHAKDRGIAVTNTPDVLTDDVADLAIALMLAVARRLPEMDRYVRGGRWETDGPPPLARRASGRRIGILGLGRIGHAIARRAERFASEIAYFSRSSKNVGWRYAATPVALADSVDTLIVSTAGGEQTHHLVDDEVLNALGPSGTLINIARGSVVDEAALVAALSEGRLGAAGLDVFDDEPRVPDALKAMANTVLLPHRGSATVETRAAMGQLVLDNVAAFLAGQPLLTPV